ncbi:thioesterase II family protein [Saccharopolyspora pogona]|uniref:thioesterase II family protein n=1 Tax=Saccharopolyspora pogona TaxID=333966 RepID=UPI0016833CEF|nr:alpha/beta fold hydrolase [Saccharopolyspora pogona]
MSLLKQRAELWFRRYRPAPTTPSVRLVCFAHAGGGPSAFRTWHEGLPADVDVLAVRYPGRQDRLTEAPFERMDSMADEVTEALLPLNDVPIALFGHSMGSWVAYEVAQRWERQGLPLRGLFVSGQPSPLRERPRALHLLDDDGLVQEVRRLGGDEDRLLEDPELRSLLLPPIRADFTLSETYRPQPTGRLRTLVSAYAGVDDAEAAEPDLMTWAEVTSGGFGHRILPGGHFYLVEHEAALLQEIAGALS